MHALLLAGGKGTRLWPLSKAHTPKQLLSPLGEQKSLLEMTIDRTIHAGFTPKNIHLVTAEEQVPLFQNIWHGYGSIISEPTAKNTGPAVLLATKKLISEGCDPYQAIYVFSTDHYITDFNPDLSIDLKDMILCYRIIPTRPETGYGYINTHSGGNIKKVRSFKEKPTSEIAQQWFEDWQDDSKKEEEKFFWNAGIYAFTINSLFHALQQIDEDLARLWHDSSYEDFLAYYTDLPKSPFDKLIAEQAHNLYSAKLPASSWRDIGTWQSIYEALNPQAEANIHIGKGQLIVDNARSCLVSSDQDYNIVCGGVDNIAVIIKDNNILIVDKNNTQVMASLVQTLQNNHADLLK